MVKVINDLIKKLRGNKNNKRLYRSGWNLTEDRSEPMSAYLVEETSGSSKRSNSEDKRIAKKPVEVFKEILSEEPKVNLNNLDQQIALVKRRMNFLIDELGMQASDEKEALKFLEARKELVKNKTLFGWAVTTFSKIEELCKKYKVRLVDFQSFYKCVPMEAIDELEKFIDAYRKVSKDEPILKLIIDEGGKETKKDPILLASSPFGKWFFVLGAWDKEVEIVDDLIYNGK